MLHIDIGRSALRAQQQAMATLSNNIANASNEAYTRQRVQFAARPDLNLSGQWQGTGVEITEVQRLLDKGVQVALLDQRSHSSAAQVQLDFARRIEGLFLPGDGSLTNTVNSFFNAARELAARPDEAVVREQFVGAAALLSAGVNQALTAFQDLQRDVAERLSAGVVEANSLAGELIGLNRQLISSQQLGTSSNALQDRRDQVLLQLAEYVDLDTASVLRGSTGFSAAGGTLYFGHQQSTLAFNGSVNGDAAITSELGAVTPRSGTLGGLLAAHANLTENFIDFENWATQLIGAIDHIHATSLTTAGGYAVLEGARGVSDLDVPLAVAGLDLPIQLGELYLTTTNQTTGERFVHQIPVDPQIDTLRDLTTRISAVPHVTGSLDAQTGRLRLTAATGYRVDFSSRLPTQPDLTGWTGASQPRISGSYRGEGDRQLMGEVVQGGTIGVDTDVLVRVRDVDTGAEIGLLNLGLGTAVNQPQAVLDGIELSFSAGQLIAGETFAFPAVASSDSAGLLSALGMGTLFTGSPGRDLAVRTEIRKNSRLLATGQDRGVADGTGAARLSDLAATTSTELGNFVARTGMQVVSWQARANANQVYEDELGARRDSLSGVDPNEEVLQLMEFQRSFQAASRLVISIDQTLDDLFAIIR